MTIQQLKDYVKDRLWKKIRKARSAFVNARMSKKTVNCHFAGRKLSPELRVCKKIWSGKTGQEAQSCWNEKAQCCSAFAPKHTSDEVKQEFDQLNYVELSLMWPQIGELINLDRVIDAEESGNKVLDGTKPIERPKTNNG